MAKIKRIKRRLLRQAVRENVALIQGLMPRSVRRGPRILNAALRASFLILTPMALFASTYVFSLSGLEPIPIPFYHARTTLAGLSPSFPPATTIEDTYAPPQAIDPAVFPLSVRKIVLDPGHGGSNSGTVTPQGLEEKELTLDIALRLRRLLERADYQVVMTRDDDVAVPLQDRVFFANDMEGDIFVSIHVNWIVTRHVRGVETYYLGPTNDPYLNRLARSENRNSGYSLADFRRLLEGVYVGVRQDESRDLAEAVQTALHRSLREVNPKLQNRGVKTAPFVVLIGTQMPAILAEVSCLSNRQEAERLEKERYRQYIAVTLFDGIHSYAESLNHTVEKGTS